MVQISFSKTGFEKVLLEKTCGIAKALIQAVLANEIAAYRSDHFSNVS